MVSTCLLVSGNLGYQVLKDLYSSSYCDIVAAFTDSKSIQCIEFCEKNNIPIFIGNPRGGNASEFIKKIDCSILFSINYLFIIESDLITLPKLYAINIHGSLLPKYRGRTPHVWAIINGETKTGITAHLIDEKVDNGDIIEQIEVPIGENDTGANVLNKFNELYPTLIEKVYHKLAVGELNSDAQEKELSTYFGKRTPEDGHIDWSWSKERIRNWIRAQAHPYPGAFFFSKKCRIIVNRASFSNLGFSYMDENGTILKVSGKAVFVKTSNGVLKLDDLMHPDCFVELKKGMILK